LWGDYDELAEESDDEEEEEEEQVVNNTSNGLGVGAVVVEEDGEDQPVIETNVEINSEPEAEEEPEQEETIPSQPKSLYTILPEKQTSVSGFMGSSHLYDIKEPSVEEELLKRKYEEEGEDSKKKRKKDKGDEKKKEFKF
jgi:splicing factor 3B subunit 2